MSTEAPPELGLGDWIRALVDACDLDPAGGGARLRSVVGTRRARIALDDEVVEVALQGATISIGPVQHAIPVDGTGATTTGVVVALLDGDLEVAHAFHDGSIEATGHRQAVTRIFHAIEILLDASSRVPEMRRLAGDFHRQARRRSASRPPTSTSSPADLGAERAVLDRLGLLGDRP